MKNKLVASILQRLGNEISDRNPLKYLKSIQIGENFDSAIATLYLYTRAKRGQHKSTFYMAEVISAIGHNFRNKLKLKRDSALAARTGAFFLYSFELMGLVSVKLGKGTNGHAAYIIEVLDDEALTKLWTQLDSTKTEKLPSKTPYAPWTSAKHETGAWMVKTGNKDVISKLTPETHPIVFDCINKAQVVGWNINKAVYDLHLWALRNKTDAFAEIWELHNPEAKATKLREVKAIGSIAKRFVGETFYHIYTFDFR